MSDTFHSRLTGFSGATVELHRKGRRSWVRKFLEDKGQAHRLELEVQKLTALHDLADTSGLFRVPAVFEIAQSRAGKLYYDMEYIVGDTVENQIEEMDTEQMKQIAQDILAIHTYLSQQKQQKTPLYPTDRDFIHFKLDESLGCLRDTPHSEGSALQSLIHAFEELIESVKAKGAEWTSPACFAHGDLTLENILVDRKKALVLIDPLQNGYDSLLWDISKVLQSTLVQWRQIRTGRASFDSESKRVHVATSMKLKEFHGYYWRLVEPLIEGIPVHLYLGVTLARIIKYAINPDVKTILLCLTNEFLKVFVDGEIKSGQYFHVQSVNL